MEWTPVLQAYAVGTILLRRYLSIYLSVAKNILFILFYVGHTSIFWEHKVLWPK